MSIYDKTVADLTTSDLQELSDEQAVENIRLEFKREAPDKDEALKKISSFANTYGGYLLIGANADSKSGRLLELSGIQDISGFKHRIVQWCYDSLSPPVQPFVSDPIASPVDKSRICYVIFVDESAETPHFINSRKGVYIRTDEYSQRFEPRLATFDEIQHLTNRRALAISRRSELLQRSDERFKSYVQYEYTSGAIGATLKLAISPKFPVVPLVQHKELLDITQRTRVSPWRSVGFPRQPGITSQHESAIICGTGADFSMLETNVWGQLYYATELVRELKTEGVNTKGIHLYWFIGHLLVYLEHARMMYSEVGFDGTLEASIRLEHILRVPFIYSWGGSPESSRSSRLDDALEFRLNFTNEDLQSRRDEVAGEMLQTIFLGLNWPDAANDESINQLIGNGYTYNKWQRAASA